MDSSLDHTLRKRRAVLKDALRAQSQKLVSDTSNSEATRTKFGDEELLLKDLRERRLQRRDQLSPLKIPPSSITKLSSGGVDSTLKEDIFPPKQPSPTLRHLREQKKLTRFDDPASEYVLGVAATTSRNNVRWKSLMSKVVDAAQKTNQQESYDFFTSTLENDVEESINEHSQGAEIATESAIGKENKKDTVLDENLFEGLGYPIYTPQQERLTNEAQVYFRPSSVPAVKSNNAPHYIDEEGLYVGERPKVPWSQMFTMENRILRRKDKGSGWFGEDDLLLAQSNPLRVLDTRPYILQSDSSSHSLFHSAEVKVHGHNLIDEGSDNIYQLEVDISSIHFSHHPLFSCEHVLSSQLEQTYLKYSSRDKRAINYYDEKLQALKMKINNLKQLLLQQMDSLTDDMEVRSCIHAYRKEMHVIRQSKKNFIALEYAALRKLLRLWRDLKTLRDNQGYSSTTVWLTIKKMETNLVEEETHLGREIEDELLELSEEFREQYDIKVLDYKLKLAEWKAYEAQMSAKDLTLDYTSRIPEKPQPVSPTEFNELQARNELYEYYHNSHRPPGEPLLVPELHHNNPISQQCPTTEILRREDVDKTRFLVKVFFNDQQVSQTKDCALNSDFSVYFSEIFTIQIVQWPESIKLQIFESKLLTTNFIAEVYVPIPELQQTVKNLANAEQYHFTSNKICTFLHSAVGSGNQLSSLPEAGILLCNGWVNATVCWGLDDNDRVLCPPEYKQINMNLNTDAVASLGIAGIVDLQEVKKWIEHSRLDPNDPRNAKLLQLIESIPTSEQTNYFRLVSVDDVQRYISDEELFCDKRFTMLYMRDQGHRGLKHKVVPLSSTLVSASEWKETLEYKPFADYDLPFLVFGDFYNSRREEQNKFLLDIRERVLSQIHEKKEIMLSEIVISEFIPNISALKISLVELLVPRRPLKPIRKERKKIMAQNVNISSANIVIRVIRAFNVPVREILQDNVQQGTLFSFSLADNVDRERLNTAATFGRDGIVVSPYVEVSYGGNVLRTSTACGPNPFWNEELIIPLEPTNNDFSPSNLQMITDAIHINMFDEVLIDILEDDRQRATNVHHRIEKRWLGKFILPFSTLLLRQLIEGTFQLEVPLILMGYQKDKSLNQNPLLGLDTSQHTHLQIFVSLDPPLGALPPIKDQFQSNEEVSILECASKWLKEVREKFPTRYCIATALDVNGKHVLVTRFIKPQNPPLEISSLGDNRVHLMEYLAHYVSLIPFLPDAVVFSGNCNIWSTSDQFLHMLGGDVEEHAILLCNYFLFCGINAWIILGHAVPEGETAYVLTENPKPAGSGYWLWNPSTGMHYNQNEPHSPIISVGCIFNNTNVWANIQEYDDPNRLKFILSDNKYWSPLFLQRSEPPASIQQDLQYSETDNRKVMELQERIERSVRDHIMALRSRFITRWNRHCTRILQSVLPVLEEHASSPPLHEFYSELAEIKASYELTGFPIHVHYCGIQQLLITIEKTGIHLCEDKKVEYALAVYVHSYPNDVISVWIYIVSMIPK